MTIAKSTKIENRKMWNVTGKFLIPGTRELATFDGRVFAESRHQGSRDLKDHLQEEYGKKCPRGYSFSSDFALMNLQWKEAPPKGKITPEILEALTANPVMVTPTGDSAMIGDEV